MEKQQPLNTLRDGRLKATIWENQSDKGPYHSVTLARVYEDKAGNLRETASFTGSELLRIAELAREAHGVVRNIRRDLSQEKSSNHRPYQSAPAQEQMPDRFHGRSGPDFDR